MSREALVLLVCCCDFRDGAEWLIPSKSLRNAVIWAFPGLLCILRMCAPRRAAAVVRPRGREKSADRRRRILISRLLIIRASVPRWKSPFPAYFKGFPAVSPLIPPYPAFLKYPVSPHKDAKESRAGAGALIEIFKSVGVLSEVDGKLSVLDEPSSARVSVASNTISAEQTHSEPVAQQALPVATISAKNSIVINININCTPADIDGLGEKISQLLYELSE